MTAFKIIILFCLSATVVEGKRKGNRSGGGKEGGGNGDKDTHEGKAHISYYDVLGVSGDPKTAKDEDIKEAYAKFPDDAKIAEHSAEITTAYEVLSDHYKRAMYDRYGPDYSNVDMLAFLEEDDKPEDDKPEGEKQQFESRKEVFGAMAESLGVAPTKDTEELKKAYGDFNKHFAAVGKKYQELKTAALDTDAFIVMKTELDHAKAAYENAEKEAHEKFEKESSELMDSLTQFLAETERNEQLQHLYQAAGSVVTLFQEDGKELNLWQPPWPRTPVKADKEKMRASKFKRRLSGDEALSGVVMV